MGEGAPRAPVHFPGLNEIRGITALAIVVSHVNASMGLFGLESRAYGMVGMAGFRVWVFFALSGFLNTYFLLAEKERSGSVDLRRFHVRRALRIWPVYFLAIGVAVLLAVVGVEPIPEPVPITLASYGLMVPNLAYALGLKWWPVAQLWAVGVLEQFSWFWPGVVKRSGNVLRAALVVVVVYLVVKALAWRSGSSEAYQLVRMAGFDAMALGAIGAVLVRRQSPALRLVFSKPVQVAAWAFVAWGILVGPLHLASVVDAEIHALVVTVLILNVACNPRAIVTIRSRVLDRLGRVSYELYGFHMIVVFLVARGGGGLFGKLGGGGLAHLAVQAACLVASVLVAAAARRLLAGPIGRIRARLERVPLPT